jgi:hypothetical protein
MTFLITQSSRGSRTVTSGNAYNFAADPAELSSSANAKPDH